MFAKDVKRIIRQVFDQAEHGLRRTRQGAGWYRPIDDHYLVISFRTPRHWNRHWGGFLECKLRIQDRINGPEPAREKPLEFSIISLASDEDRETLRRWYNQAARLTTNPDEADDDLTQMERELSGRLQVPLQAPLSPACADEVLLRFHSEEDVRRLARLILQRLPEWIEKVAATWRPWYESSRRHLQAQQPFLDAIRVDPDCDEPRLNYADWLAERGDPWSEVIRIQCRYPDLYMPWETADRLEKLIQQHQYRFDRGADGLGVHVRFRRGMVEDVYCSAKRFIKVADRILDTFPLVNLLSLSQVRGYGKELANRSELAVMRTLRLVQLGDEDWPWIVRSPYLNGVEQLRVAFPRPIDLAWLLDMPLARQLLVLDMTRSRLDAGMLAAFGQTDAASGLEELVLDDTAMDDEMAKRLSRVATFRALKRLSVADNRDLGIEGIACILEAEFAPRLERLAVDSGWFDDDVVRQLAESQLSSTVHLVMRQSPRGLDKDAFRKRFPNCSFRDD